MGKQFSSFGFNTSAAHASASAAGATSAVADQSSSALASLLQNLAGGEAGRSWGTALPSFHQRCQPLLLSQADLSLHLLRPLPLPQPPPAPQAWAPARRPRPTPPPASLASASCWARPPPRTLPPRREASAPWPPPPPRPPPPPPAPAPSALAAPLVGMGGQGGGVQCKGCLLGASCTAQHGRSPHLFPCLPCRHGPQRQRHSRGQAGRRLCTRQLHLRRLCLRCRRHLRRCGPELQRAGQRSAAEPGQRCASKAGPLAAPAEGRHWPAAAHLTLCRPWPT